MTPKNLFQIVDDCAARIDNGESLAAVLRDYPEYADQIREILRSRQRVHDATPTLQQMLQQDSTATSKPKNKRPSSMSATIDRQLPRWLAPVLLLGVLLALLGAVATLHQTPVQAQQILLDDDCAPLIERPSPYVNQQMPQQQNSRGGDTESGEASALSAIAPTRMAMSSSEPDRAVEEAEVGDAAYDSAPPEVDRESSDAAPGSSGAPAGLMDDIDDVPSAEDRRTLPESDPLPETNRQQIQPLRAGEIDDNAQWENYLTYRENYLDDYGTSRVDDVDVSGRQVIEVVNEDGRPVLGACVEVFLGETLVARSRTYATGQTLFFPNATPYEQAQYADEFRVQARLNQQQASREIDMNRIGDVTTLTLDTAPQTAPRLDVLFLLDATGSMSDEIQELQDNLLAISSQIDTLPQNIDTHYGLIAYRDLGDAYVTRGYPFTPDVQEFQQILNSVQAAGGGDTPESLNQGLYESVHEMAWRGDDTIQLVFLVADAPPHMDYQNDVSYALTMQDALARGIKVHPIASSNLDDSGEFILRQIAQYTMGKFLFLTYESGVPGTPGDERPDLDVGEPEDEQGAGDYSVSQLDELVLRLITDEIDALTGN